MLFDFKEFIQSLREDNEKKEIIERYEGYNGNISGEITDQLWYTEYLINLEPLKYTVPEDLKDEFDWDLLSILIAGSFSSEYKIIPSEEKLPELQIEVKSGDASVIKNISELWSYQINRLYEIYIEEQMNLHSLKGDSEQEKKAIDLEREQRVSNWILLSNRHKLLKDLGLIDKLATIH